MGFESFIQRVKSPAWILGGLIVALSLLPAYLSIRFIPGQFAPWILAGGVLVWAICIGAAIGLKFFKDRRKDRAIKATIVLLLLLVLVLPTVSMLFLRRITFARFGFTVYGIIPVPTLDVTVSSGGALGFRKKTHLLMMDEVRPLLNPGVETLIIGDGWEQMMKVEPAVKELQGIHIRILPTPEAFSLFNRSVREGRKVVLIAHSTC